jgi:hypothetical protein
MGDGNGGMACQDQEKENLKSARPGHQLRSIPGNTARTAERQ